MRHMLLASVGLLAGCGVATMESGSGTDQPALSFPGGELVGVDGGQGPRDAGPAPSPDAGPACAPGQTVACVTSCGSTGTRPCAAGGDWATECTAPQEVCGNGVDDDCDGLVDSADDECWSCTPGQTRACTTPCGSTGSQSCEGDGQWPGTCTPPPEVCGNGTDDDCDGLVDSAQPSCWSCTPGQTRSCTTSCGSTGSQSCDGSGQWPGSCNPPGENCNNGTDDDCDGLVDDRDFDCPGPQHDCTTTEGNTCNGDWGYGDQCDPADDTGGCSAARFWAWCNRRNTAYPDIWDNWIHDWVASRCDGTTVENGNTFSCTSSTNDRYSCTTPLVLVFDGAPVKYRPGGRFAFTPGEEVESDWPTADAPWLVRDLDRNGNIDDGAELFGSNTRLPDGTLALNGFQALAALDLNGDGVLNARDPAFAELRLWSDRDGDRHVGPGELVTLQERGVVYLRLGFTIDPHCDARGNCERERSSFGWTDAKGRSRAGAVVDVWLRTERLPQLARAVRGGR